MSSFAHFRQTPVFNAVVGTTVPARWDHLIQGNLATTKDSSLSGITRTIYTSPSPQTAVHHDSDQMRAVTGEIWKASQEQGQVSPSPIFKVTGYAQMYVISGSGEMTKNGETINLRPGERVSFQPEDTFSLPYNSALAIFVRNEDARFEPTTDIPKLPALCLPSKKEVAIIRSMLGISPHVGERRGPGSEVLSSRGYARSKAG